MTASNIVDEWRRDREELVRRLSYDKAPTTEITMRMSTAYSRLPRDRQVALEPLLREWLLSDDYADRYDAIAIVRENEVTSMIPTLRQLQDRLEQSTDVGAPYEWAKVNRALGRLTAAMQRNMPDDEAPERDE
jgi:hypothetical protein